MLITLSGLDGAGKSTLAGALQASLQEKGVPAVVFHMNKEVGLYAYLRRGRDRLKRVLSLRRPPAAENDAEPAIASVHEKPGALSKLSRQVIWNKSLRRWVDLGDLATFLLYRLLIEKVRGEVLIMDRYFYDRMADVADGRRWRYLRWFSRITPTPDVAVLVEVSPEEAFSRKGEYSVSSMTARRQTYHQIFGWVPTAVMLPNDDVRDASRKLEQLVFDRLDIARDRRGIARS